MSSLAADRYFWINVSHETSKEEAIGKTRRIAALHAVNPERLGGRVRVRQPQQIYDRQLYNRVTTLDSIELVLERYVATVVIVVNKPMRKKDIV